MYAVQALLDVLRPSFNKWSEDDCKQWVCGIHNCQNTIDATILGAINRQDQFVCKELRYVNVKLDIAMLNRIIMQWC